MNKENFDNDEPIHHFEGKDLLHSCPSELTFAQSGASSSPIKHSPKATISPPIIHSHKDRFQKFHKIKELLRGIFFYKIHIETIHQPMVNYNLIIGQLNITTQNNQTILQDMKNFGPIFNILNKGTIINNFGTDNQSNEQEEAEEAKDADHTEVVEVQTVPVNKETASQPKVHRKKKELSFTDSVAEKESVPILRQWLHQMMDPIPSNNPKEKLIFLRAVSEAKVFTQKLQYKAYVREFGPISSSSYYEWVHRKLKYDREDIDALIEKYYEFLKQFPK